MLLTQAGVDNAGRDRGRGSEAYRITPNKHNILQTNKYKGATITIIQLNAILTFTLPPGYED